MSTAASWHFPIFLDFEPMIRDRENRLPDQVCMKTRQEVAWIR